MGFTNICNLEPAILNYELFRTGYELKGLNIDSTVTIQFSPKFMPTTGARPSDANNHVVILDLTLDLTGESRYKNP